MSASVGSGIPDMSVHRCTCCSHTTQDGDDGGSCRRCEVQIMHVVTTSNNGAGAARGVRRDKPQRRTGEEERPEEQVHLQKQNRCGAVAAAAGSREDLMQLAPSGSVVLHEDRRAHAMDVVRDRSCSYSLTPTVKLDVFDASSVSDAGDLDEEDEEEEEEKDGDDDGAREPFVCGGGATAAKKHLLSVTVNSGHHLGLSTSSSVVSMPICRICHMPGDDEDNLISPCRCAGSMRFIHNGCLMKWLEISSKKSKKQPSCELCLYQYHRHKKFKVKHWQFPPCSIRDKMLHVIFILSLIVMIGAATVTVMCFKHDKGGRVNLDKNQLTRSEVITLVCGVLFFVAFFVAMYVEVKARNTIYKLFLDFLYLNQQWYIDEYDKKADIQPVPV